jgi:hypothetical protein
MNTNQTNDQQPQQQQQQQQPQQQQQNNFANRTPGSYAGGPGPHPNQTITLYAQDGSTKQAQTDQFGAVSWEDRQWLADHGGALPINMVPQQDKAIVGKGTVATNLGINAPQGNFQGNPVTGRTPGSYAGGAGPHQRQVITLYAQDGSTKQSQTDQFGAISSEDRQWLADHGGALPVNMVPQQDKAIVGKGTVSTNLGLNAQSNFQGNSATGRTPGSYAGGPGPNQRQNITLYAQDGSTKQSQTDQFGAISSEDRQWLADHGGALPINMVPPQDKAIVGKGTVVTNLGAQGNQPSGQGLVQ